MINRRYLAALFAVSAGCSVAEAPHIHDPSQVQTFDNRQRIVATGKENTGGYLCGLEVWERSDDQAPWTFSNCLFEEKPAWIQTELPGNEGAFWAPDITPEGHLVYSVSAGFDDLANCAGLAYRDDDGWRDSGAPLTCIFGLQDGREVSSIDPSVFHAFDGTPFLVTGGGMIHGAELDPKTLRPLSGDWFEPGHPDWPVLAHGPMEEGERGWVEASYILPHDGFYYLFVNWGGCCAGLDSTYEIRVGRSQEPLGPYLDRDGRDMVDGGGSVLLSSSGNRIGPGHASTRRTTNGLVLGYHFYDRLREGLPWQGENRLLFEDGWPVVGEPLPVIRP
ncbi:MAG: arabinan endo-1,5-alpha-L-arabinosidase [Pseudomonadota bacterium]